MSNLDSIKKHFKKHKETYIVGGVCLATGIVIGSVIMLQKNTTLIDVSSIRVLSSGDNNTFIVAANGDPGNVVRCLEDNVLYPSQNAAAKALNVDKATVSRHLNGALPDVKGIHLERLGKAGHNLAA